MGEDTELYLKKGFNVVAIEAHPILATMLTERFSEAISEGRMTVVASAISKVAGEVEFFVNQMNTVWGTADPTWAERNRKMGAPSRRITVPSVEFGTLLERYGVPYYLKIDIEGADMLCVSGLHAAKARPHYLSIESSKTSWQALLEEFEELERLGYQRFKVVNQARVHMQIEPETSAEGCHSGHTLQYGSTGLFGSDLPGPWLTKAQALRRYAMIFFQYRHFGDNTRGLDIVRRLPLLRMLVPAWYDTHAALS